MQADGVCYQHQEYQYTGYTVTCQGRKNSRRKSTHHAISHLVLQSMSLAFTSHLYIAISAVSTVFDDHNLGETYISRYFPHMNVTVRTSQTDYSHSTSCHHHILMPTFLSRHRYVKHRPDYRGDYS